MPSTRPYRRTDPSQAVEHGVVIGGRAAVARSAYRRRLVQRVTREGSLRRVRLVDRNDLESWPTTVQDSEACPAPHSLDQLGERRPQLLRVDLDIHGGQPLGHLELDRKRTRLNFS